MDNVPIVTLMTYNETEPQWQAVLVELRQAKWSHNMIVPVIQWVDRLNDKGYNLMLDLFAQSHIFYIFCRLGPAF